MKADPARLAQIHAACFTDTRHWSMAEFSELLENPTSIITAQTHGFALGRVVADEAEILTIAVTPNEQRNGIGGALLSNLESTAKSAGVTRIFLEVSKQNHGAIALYQNAGFTQTGLRKGYYATAKGPAIDGLILSKRLA